MKNSTANRIIILLVFLANFSTDIYGQRMELVPLLVDTAKLHVDIHRGYAIWGLKRGDSIPDNLYSNVLNYKDSVIKFSDFGKKEIIMDMWDFGCHSCIDAIPTMEKYQEKYGSRIQVILVNLESKAATKKFLLDHPRIKMPELPMITEDTLLSFTYFRHIGNPHFIWLTDSLKVDQITSIPSERQIQSVINGEHPIFAQQLQYTSGNVKIVEDPAESDSLILFHSSLTHVLPMLNFSIMDGNWIYAKETGKLVGLYFASVTLRDLLGFIMVKIHPFSDISTLGEIPSFTLDSRTILNVAQRDKWVMPQDFVDRTAWKRANEYRYMFRAPALSPDRIPSVALGLLETILHVKVRIIPTKVQCLEFIDMPGYKKPIKDIVESDKQLSDKEASNFVLKTITLTSLRDYIYANDRRDLPIVNRCKDKSRMVTISIKDFTQPSIRQALNRYGIDFVEREDTIDMVDISDDANVADKK